MDEARRKLIASMGGKVAHQKGRAYTWTKETAKLAGSKGGRETARRNAARKAAESALVAATNVNNEVGVSA
jgi:hypothetical protein